MLDAVTRDIREAIRGLRTRPAYAVVTILTLTLVIGAACAVIAVVNATMIRPLPYPDADRLVRIYLQPPGTTEVRHRNPLGARALLRFRQGAAEQIDAVEGITVRERAIGSDGEPESVPGGLATPGALTLLGGPLLGRAWSHEEDAAGARVTVISHAFWQRRFGGAPDAVGRFVTIDRERYEIIGVMPPGFHAMYQRSELWTPLNLAAQNIETPTTYIATVARLRPGTTIESLRAELPGAMARIVAEAPAQLAGWTAGATSLREAQFGSQRPALVLLVLAVAALTLIACANLANVTLAQVMTRRSEFALRSALGASRWQTIRLQLVESSVLAGAGAMGGLLLGALALPVVLALDPQTARVLGTVDVDWRVQAVVAVVTIVVTLLSGVLPVIREAQANVVDGIVAGSRRSVSSREDGRWRRGLVAAEAALAVMLLASGGLLLSAFARSAQIRPGFDPANVLTAQVRLSPTAYSNAAARNAFVARMLERVGSTPGVVRVATTTNPFVPGSALQTLLHIEGQPRPDGQPHTMQFRRVSPGYFHTLRIPLLAGRDFAVTDGADAPLVAIVSRTLAEKHWPGQDPIGRRVLRSGAAISVIGVVDEVSDVGFGQPPEPTFYVPYTQNNPVASAISLVVRTAGDPLRMAAEVRAAIASVDPMQPLDNVVTLEQFLHDSLGPQRFRSTLLLLLAGLGCALAAVGVYGVTARMVHERTREVGVRLALGASPHTIWRLVASSPLRAVGLGACVGIALGIGANTMLIRVVPGLDQAEPLAAVPAIGILLVTAILAAAIPAHRVVRVTPAAALNQ